MASKYDKTGLGSKEFYRLTEEEARKMQIELAALDVMEESRQGDGYEACGPILYPDLYPDAYKNRDRQK